MIGYTGWAHIGVEVSLVVKIHPLHAAELFDHLAAADCQAASPGKRGGVQNCAVMAHFVQLIGSHQDGNARLKMTMRFLSPVLLKTTDGYKQPVRPDTPNIPSAAMVRYTHATPAAEPINWRRCRFVSIARSFPMRQSEVCTGREPMPLLTCNERSLPPNFGGIQGKKSGAWRRPRHVVSPGVRVQFSRHDKESTKTTEHNEENKTKEEA